MTNRRPSPVRLRSARLADAGAIATIYNDAVRTSVATFDTVERSLHHQRRWLEEHARERLPVIVAVSHGLVVGWASVSRWSERKAYSRTAEVSVYVAAGNRGSGIGGRLLATLIRAATRQGLHVLLARIADGNAVSLRLHRSSGFTTVGTMREVGYKFGRFVDVTMLQLALPPRPPARRRRAV